ncbi:MAG: tetratricopeptide repeat protein, partial [Balneolales bacterium]|nr:tetratricopeptide repeat protein [Balneolales bacterium]
MRSRFVWCLLAVVLLSGCSIGLQQRWGDFNAYYNTFYNAKQGYDRGIRSMENQQHEFNPERPIRVHRIPVRAGQTDFEQAIEKSADILRNHDQSKWVDDALELIGKSYFNLSQFFSAEQKFNEILSTSDNENIRQRAIYWRGRVYLETSRYNEGISYLTANLLSEEYEWNRQILHEIELILAQLHVQLENWEEADRYLIEGANGINDNILRSRANFLHGQVLERLGRYDDAIVAYAGVSRRYPEYQLIYLSTLKRNQLLRQQGEHERAYRNFIAMSRDDKNFDQLSELEFEIGRSLQKLGRYDDAFNAFDDVLYSSLQNPTRETIAKTHYAIAELYRFHYGDFTMAAMYYDSSSRSATDLTRMPEQFDAAELASSFGDYARLTEQIQKSDSLMHLGRLPPDEFEARLIEIRDQRLREFERQQRQDQLRGTTLVTITDQGQQTDEQQGRDNGFLNHRNPVLVAQAAESFAALWEGRPLVDNWRRYEAVRRAITAREEDDENGEDFESGLDGDVPAGAVNVAIPEELQINLNEIPFTEADQLELGKRIANYEYELGNVFYLNLNMPDSALYHYLRVVEEFKQAEVRPQAMYSIADIYLSVDNIDVASEWGRSIIQEYPTSIMADRIANRLNLEIQIVEEIISDEAKAKNDYHLLLDSLSNHSLSERIAKLSDFMERHPEAPQKPEVLFNKALVFAEMGRSDVGFSQKFAERELQREIWSEKYTAFQDEQELAMEALLDTTLSEEDMEIYSN